MQNSRPPKTRNSASILARSWKDTWQWILNTRFAWVVAMLVAGITGGVFVGNTVPGRILAGFVGALIVIALMVGIAFIYNLLLTPSQLRKEARHKFIKENASYSSRIIGNPLKSKYLAILEVLKSMIKVENNITDNIAGKHILTVKEFNALQKRLSKETNVDTLPLHKGLKIYLRGDVTKKVNQTINKLKLQFPQNENTFSENQIRFLLSIRYVLDDFGIGLSSELEKSFEYKNLLNKLDAQIPNKDDIPDWVIYLLVIPSGLNSIYIFGSAIPRRHREMFLRYIPPVIINYPSKRDGVTEQLVQIAKESIEAL